MTEPTSPEPVPAPPKGRRLAWLDALRGFAALCVVFDHMGTLVLQRPHNIVYRVLDTGQYGVFVFFLVSGYIIPASLERKGSVRGFWVSRGFRLYPLYIVAIALSILAYKTGYGVIHGAQNSPKNWAYSLPFMLSNMLNGANVPNVIWTLSFEMVFYLLLTALFTYRVHRHSGVYALAAVLGAVALGGILPVVGLNGLHLFGHLVGSRRVAILADVGIFTGLALAVTGRQRLRAVGVVIAAGTGLVLLLFNISYPGPDVGLVILGLMFTGTMLYRAEQGQMPWKHALAIAGAVLVLAIAAGLWHGPGGWTPGDLTKYRIQWVSCLVLAGATFAPEARRSAGLVGAWARTIPFEPASALARTAPDFRRAGIRSLTRGRAATLGRGHAFPYSDPELMSRLLRDLAAEASGASAASARPAAVVPSADDQVAADRAQHREQKGHEDHQ